MEKRFKLLTFFILFFIYAHFFEPHYQFVRIASFCTTMLIYMFYVKIVLAFDHKRVNHKFNTFLCNHIFKTNIEVKNEVPILTKPHVIMANHYNATDLTIIKKALGLHMNTIAKSDLVTSENTVLPIFNCLQKTFFNAFYIIPYTRGDKKSGSDVKNKILKSIHDGNHVLIFPEGTSHRDGIPKMFKNGIFHLCHDHDIPILPVTIKFDKDIGLEREDIFQIRDVFDTNVSVYIHSVDSKQESMEELRDKTFNKIISPFQSKEN